MSEKLDFDPPDAPESTVLGFRMMNQLIRIEELQIAIVNRIERLDIMFEAILKKLE